jgi:predicted MPP superfamily phosphohydrolase
MLESFTPDPALAAKQDIRRISRRTFMATAAAASAGIALYAGTHGRHEFEVVRRTFAIRNLPDALVGFRIVQISDIHLEEFTEAWFLEKMVAEINGLAPDLVLITGDFVSRGPRSDSVAWKAAGLCAEILSTLKAPQRFAVLGNHDVAVGADHVIQPLEAHGTPVLVDRFFPIERGSDRFWLAGSDDADTQIPDLSRSVPDDPRAPVILMAHEPDFADYVVRHPRFPLVDLMLSGHTHGGQVKLPFLGPLVLPDMGKNYVEGLYRFGHMQLYVNRGLGTVGMPFRLNCSPEITHMTLMRA